LNVDVFISYARSESRDQARSIAAALKDRGISAFLDEKEIGHGQRFPVELSEAMREARIVLVLLSEAYLEKPWCAFELRISLAPYKRVRAEAPPDHVVFGLPDRGDMQRILPHLPPRLAQTNWPQSSDTPALTELIVARLPQCIQNLCELLKGLDPKLLDSLGSGGEIPIAGRPGLLAGWHNDLPRSLNERFHGREAELWSLFHLLQIGEVTEGTRSCVISGGAGMGKTQLAAEFAHRYGPVYYRGGVVWIDAAQNERIESPPWREIVRGLGVTKFPSEATDKWALNELAPAIRRRVTEGPVLWIVDNLPEISPGERALSLDRWCPIQSLVTLICTSRQPGVAGCDARIELSETDVDDAILILTDGGVVRGQLEERQWKDIVRWVGGLPLALRILNASLVEGFCTPLDLHSASQSTNAVEHLDGEFETLVSEVPAGSLHGISMAFDISLDSLRSNEAALAAALRIARLAPVPIPDPLLANIADRRILGQLKSRHWLLGDAERHNDEAGGGWRMHRLTAGYLRSRSIDPPQELSDLARAMTGALSHPESLGQIPSSRLLSHMLKVLSDLAQPGIDKLRPESLAAARNLILTGAFFRLEEDESDDLRSWAASFAVRFGVDGEIVEQLEALCTDGDPDRWPRLLSIVRSLKESRASVPLLLRLLQDGPSHVQRATLWIAGFHEAQDELAIPSLHVLLTYFPQGALYTASPLETDIMKYLGTLDPLWELPTSQDIRDMLESLSRNDRLPAMIEVVKPRLKGTESREELERLLDAYVLCLRAHYTPLPTRAYSAGRWDPIEETDLGGYTEFHMPRAREVDDADFEPLVELMLTSLDEETVRHTVRLMATFIAGTNSLSQAVHSALDAGRPDRALLLADQTLEVRKDFANGWWWRALALDEMGQEELLWDALSAYGRVVNLQPEFVDARVRHATLALKLGDFERGLRSARVLTKLQPGDGLAYHLQACALLNLNRPKEAVEAASEAVRLAPNESEAWLFQALAYEQLKELEKARTAAKRAADLNPEDLRARECLDRLG
jgi:tetratricopeptide (TPR) repeat protein